MRRSRHHCRNFKQQGKASKLPEYLISGVSVELRSIFVRRATATTVTGRQIVAAISTCFSEFTYFKSEAENEK
jgi:hypothetical protein